MKMSKKKDDSKLFEILDSNRDTINASQLRSRNPFLESADFKIVFTLGWKF